MTQQEKYDLFVKIERYFDTKEGKEKIIKIIDEYIKEKNYVHYKDFNLGDKNIYTVK